MAQDDHAADEEGGQEEGEGALDEQDEQRDDGGGGDRGEGDVAPLPEYPGEDEKGAEHGERREDEEDAEGGGHPFAPLEAEIDGVAVAEEGGGGDQGQLRRGEAAEGEEHRQRQHPLE